jgi:hypothetical protein
MDDEKTARDISAPALNVDDTGLGVGVGDVVNASGHKQELERQFSLLSICSVGITAGNQWAALGGSIVGFRLFPPPSSHELRAHYNLSRQEPS